MLQCNIAHVLHEISWSGRLKGFLGTMWNAFMYMLEHSYVSLGGTLALMTATISFVPTKLSRKKRAIIGVVHVSAHLTAALILLMLLELGIEICIRNQLLAASGTTIHCSVHFGCSTPLSLNGLYMHC